MPVQSFLRSAPRMFDVAFVDPPYDLAADTLTGDLTLLRPHLADDALVIVERATRSGPPEWEAARLRALRQKAYGDTTLWWGEPAI